MPRLKVVDTVQPGPAPLPPPPKRSIATRVLGLAAKRRFGLPNFGVVEEGRIYRSAQLTESGLRRVVSEYGIRTVIALNEQDAIGEREERICRELGVSRLAFPWVGDGSVPPEVAARTMFAIAEQDHWPLLIHCHAGAQRTSTVVLLYRYLYQGLRVRHTYPEHFHYKHSPRQWKVLAYLVDYMADIKAELARLEAQDAAHPDHLGVTESPSQP
ncbi:MAG: hypothetical protein ACF8MJ_13965 [Phycisphaerales bacterium JB050]